jgi:FKBP-type peptidyl-prolyl cis-trans isomerase FkpA
LCNMLKNAVLAMCFVLCLALFSCAKEEIYDRNAQLQLDIDSISRFVTMNKIPATNDGSGLFVQILVPGSGMGKDTIAGVDSVTITYSGRLLNGALIENPALPVSLVYSGLIEGWKRGLKKIQPGGQIRLIIPSTMAYTDKRVGIIPPNSNLDYTIGLLRVSKIKAPEPVTPTTPVTPK